MLIRFRGGPLDAQESEVNDNLGMISVPILNCDILEIRYERTEEEADDGRQVFILDSTSFTWWEQHKNEFTFLSPRDL